MFFFFVLILVKQAAPGFEEPVKYDFAGWSFFVDFAFQVIVVFFALCAESDEFLVEAVVLQEAVFAEHAAHVFYPVAVGELVKLLLFEDF